MIRYRLMNPQDLRRVLDWAAEEGWNPGLDDADAFIAADPTGFFLAEHSGEPVAAISVVNHAPDFAFLGLYLCRPSHRGRGIGHALWTHAIGHAGDRTIGLDGVPDQQANYTRSGFVHAGETVRYCGAVPARRHGAIRQATPADRETMIALEAAASGAAKPAYMGAWVTDSASRRSFVLESGGTVSGMVTVRRCRSGAKIGPLIAPDDASAMALLHHAAAETGPEISVDIPQGSAGLARDCAALGLTPAFRTARMYRGPAPRPGTGVLAVASLELG